MLESRVTLETVKRKCFRYVSRPQTGWLHLIRIWEGLFQWIISFERLSLLQHAVVGIIRNQTCRFCSRVIVGGDTGIVKQFFNF